MLGKVLGMKIPLPSHVWIHTFTLKRFPQKTKVHINPKGSFTQALSPVRREETLALCTSAELRAGGAHISERRLRLLELIHTGEFDRYSGTGAQAPMQNLRIQGCTPAPVYLSDSPVRVSSYKWPVFLHSPIWTA